MLSTIIGLNFSVGGMNWSFECIAVVLNQGMALERGSWTPPFSACVQGGFKMLLACPLFLRIIATRAYVQKGRMKDNYSK